MQQLYEEKGEGYFAVIAIVLFFVFGVLMLQGGLWLYGGALAWFFSVLGVFMLYHRKDNLN